MATSSVVHANGGPCTGSTGRHSSKLARLLLAASVFLVAADGGSYSLTSRNSLAIVLWWTIVVAVVLRFAFPTPVGRPVVATATLLLCFALLALASSAWGASTERALDEFNRVGLYLAVYVLAVGVVRRTGAAALSDGVAAGITAVAATALASRFFPGFLPSDELARILPSSTARLSYPVNYWNGLGILVALAFPLLFRAAVAAERPVWRGLAIAPIPALAATVYLTSSRAGAAFAVVGTMLFVAITDTRMRAAGAVAAAAVGSAASIVVLLVRPELVNEPGSDVAATQGNAAALLITVICLGVGACWAGGVRLVRGKVAVSRTVRRYLVVAALLASVALILVADPQERVRGFTASPPGETLPEPASVEAHLASGGGSGRWQLWQAAFGEFREHPVLGGGAGSYEAWWAQHGTLRYYVRDAHSLYLEVLGELGVVGLSLLVAAFAVALLAAARHLRSASSVDRMTLAATTASLVIFSAGAGVDWMWELTAVSLVGVILLALLTAPRVTTREAVAPRRRLPAVGVVTVVLVGAFFIVSAAAPLLADGKIQDSHAAAARGDGTAALSDALDARALAPWAASPYLQLALVSEEVGDLRTAGRWIREAIRRDETDWRLWLVRARVELRSGAIGQGRRSLGRAAELNPRSPLFAAIQRHE